MGYYSSPRWSNEIADCSMPMTFDTYSNCSFGCLYCFSQFQRAIGGCKAHYLKKEVTNVNPDTIKRMFSEPDKYGGQFATYIKQRRVMQWGGLSDQFDGYERKYGVTLDLLKFFKEIDYRCGDNGIFRGMPITSEQELLTLIARHITDAVPYDGKYIIDGKRTIICQSHIDQQEAESISSRLSNDYGLQAVINPLGSWTGGLEVDAGATNRKLGSDMGDAVTGGGLHGKDLSKADVTLNIYAHLKAQQTGKPFSLLCAIGDDKVDGKSYGEIVEIARKYIFDLGGFEKFAEWGLIR